jgi:hypothetical protein
MKRYTKYSRSGLGAGLGKTSVCSGEIMNWESSKWVLMLREEFG